jgi:hypothetical protein
MNYLQKQEQRKNLIELMKNPRPLRGFYSRNSIEHETTKLQIALILSKQGFEVFPECEFKRGRGDLVAIKGHIGYCIEVLDSEKESDCNIKAEQYPEELTLVKVKTKDFDPKTWCI